MRVALFSLFSVVVLTGCPDPDVARPPPMNEFNSPYGLVHADSPFSDAGVLYVTNANVNKSFDNGAVLALNLDRVALPPFGAPVSDGGVVQVPAYEVGAASQVAINNYAGELTLYTPDAGNPMLFVTTRSERYFVHALNVTPLGQVGGEVGVQCALSPDMPQDCLNKGVSMTQFERSTDNQPRALAPLGVAVAPSGEVYITHAQAGDTPKGALENYKSYLVKLAANDFTLSKESFIELGAGASTAVAVGNQWAFVSGRYVTPQAQLIRMVSRDGKVLNAGIEGAYRVLESRGLALSTDQQRIYVVGRAPDTLLVLSVTGADTAAPSLRVERAVPLPEGADHVRIISRPGRGDLVLVVCSTAKMLAIYDQDVGDLVAQVANIGPNPAQVAVDLRGDGARLYVSIFGDGRVAVIDIPHLAQAQTARLVAHLGRSRLCADGSTRGTSCDGGSR